MRDGFWRGEGDSVDAGSGDKAGVCPIRVCQSRPDRLSFPGLLQALAESRIVHDGVATAGGHASIRKQRAI
jgi:hypothetical protein